MTPTDLIARLSSATEGSRELDFQVWCVDSEYEYGGLHENGWCFVFKRPDGYVGKQDMSSDITPHYTTSIDAALSLVPEGWSRHLHEVPWNGLIEVSISDGNRLAIQGNAKTLPLALVVAALKARETKEN